MICRKQLVLTGYRVRYVDLRESKPRTVHEEIHVADSEWIDACGVLGVSPPDRIKDWYEVGGYKVIGIEKVKPKRTIVLDLQKLWEQAELPEAESSDDEVVDHE